jgi:hypothetical protein
MYQPMNAGCYLCVKLGDKEKSVFYKLIPPYSVRFVFLLACTWLAGAGPLCLLPCSLLRRAAGQSQANLHGYWSSQRHFIIYLP